MSVLNCEYCGRFFCVKPYRIKTARFCSRRCLGKAQLPEINEPRLAAIRGKKAANNRQGIKWCMWCGKVFWVSPSRVNSKKYCSRQCYGKSQQKTQPSNKYSRLTVKGVRMYEHRHIMERLIHRKLKRGEQVHHLNGDRQDNDPFNLMILNIREHGSLSSKNRNLM